MLLRQKIAQMLVLGFSGCEIDNDSLVVKWIRDLGLGGVILFDFDLKTKTYGKNIKNREQIKRLTAKLANYTHNDGHPLFIAIDYEGGAVDRLKKIDEVMITMKAFDQALLSDDDLSYEAGKMASLLKELGFNVNFAPIVDLNLNSEQGIIGKLGRSFSNDPYEVIRAAKLFVQAFNNYGIACSYKHFPGHGSASGDTHEGFVDVSESFDPKELIPYEILLKDSTLPPSMVMTAHVINRQLDNSGLPATLSHEIITGILRKKIGFNGLVISDDLQMQAIANHYSVDEALSLTINAGADLVIFGNQLGDITATEVVDRIEKLVETGKIPISRIEDAYNRVVKFKEELFSHSAEGIAI